MSGGNPARGEATLAIGGVDHRVRPSFEALVAAEGELGSLIALTERAAAGGLTLGEVAALIWHCIERRDELAREAVGEAVLARGLSGVLPVVRTILGQLLMGR